MYHIYGLKDLSLNTWYCLDKPKLQLQQMLQMIPFCTFLNIAGKVLKVTISKDIPRCLHV